MKGSIVFFISLAVLCPLVCPLELTRQPLSYKHYVYSPKHNGNYFRELRNHKSEQFVQKVVQENRRFIQQFNQQNKKNIQAVKAGQQGVKREDIHSFMLGQTPFIQFTNEEFRHYFTGVKLSKQAQHHMKVSEKERQEHKRLGQSKGQVESRNQHQRDYSKHGKIARMLLQKMKAFPLNEQNNQAANELSRNQGQQVLEQQVKVQRSHKYQDQEWDFYDPYQMDHEQFYEIYGDDVNSDDSWGWDWEDMDNQYYSQYGHNDNEQEGYQGYYDHWQKEHWGFTWDEWRQGEQSGGEFQKSQYGLQQDDQWWKWILEGSQGQYEEDTNNWENGDQQLQDAYENSDWWFNEWENDNSQGQNDNSQGQNDNSQGQNDNNLWWDQDGQSQYQQQTEPDLNVNDKSTLSKLQPFPDDAVEVNWVKKAALTHIKDQGICGSCWSFSTASLVQSWLIIQGQPLLDLSQQQLLDCQKQNNGCGGGDVGVALDFVRQKGLVTEDKYPYRGLNGQCKKDEGMYKIKKYTRISQGKNMQVALRKGPITGYVYANMEHWKFYKKGIFDKCQAQPINHAIVIVGFTKDYWIIRNSWGVKWGEQGYIRIKRDQNFMNACSIEEISYFIG